MRSLVYCCHERRSVVYRLVENDVDMIVPVNLHQMHYRVHLGMSASARLTREFLILAVVLEVLILYIGLFPNHTGEDASRLLWFSVQSVCYLLYGLSFLGSVDRFFE